MPNTRKYNWEHNSLLGSALRSYQDYRRIWNAQSTTEKAKQLAIEINHRQRELAQELKTYRVNQDGTTTKMRPS